MKRLFPMQLEFYPFSMISKGIKSPNLELRTQNGMEKTQALYFVAAVSAA